MPTLPCPAKINLFLEIRGRRADGYHELGTLFQALETGDTLSAEPWDTLEIAGAEGVTAKPEDNLVHKAAVLLQRRFGDRIRGAAGIRFTVDKRLPAGAGLGGGSSDAAAALRLAAAIWGLDLSAEEFRTLGAELGSDVPFFLSSPSAFAEGRGELLSAAPPPYPFLIVVATPSCHVDTAWAYRQLQGKPFGSRWIDFRENYRKMAQNPEFYATLHNDFEEPVAAQFPEIREVRDVLNTFSPVKTLLSGSGASLFALFRPEFAENAQSCLRAVAPRCRFSVLTRFWGKPEFF